MSLTLAGVNEKRGRQIPPLPAKTASLLYYNSLNRDCGGFDVFLADRNEKLADIILCTVSNATSSLLNQNQNIQTFELD